jgi:hypothetical protein
MIGAEKTLQPRRTPSLFSVRKSDSIERELHIYIATLCGVTYSHYEVEEASCLSNNRTSCVTTLILLRIGSPQRYVVNDACQRHHRLLLIVGCEMSLLWTIIATHKHCP